MAAFAASVRASAVRFVRGVRPGTAAAFAEANHERLALWVPVLFGAGVALYFSLPAEPAPWTGPLAAGLAALGVLALRRERGAGYLLAIAATLVAGGFTAAQLRTATTAAPRIARELGPLGISGRVLHAEPTDRGVRLLLDDLDTPRLRGRAVPERVRISVRSAPREIRPGDRIRLLAVLQPPPEPSLPGGYDFARRAWFERIGAVGYALGAPKSLAPGDGGSASLLVARLRQHVTARILAAADPAIAPVAAALMTGERRAIPEETLADMRDSGLAHLLAISGLHIGLVAGLLFFAVRFGLAAIESVALRYPIKKIAAVAAMAGAFGYLVVSGATIPTQRAFLMVLIALFAVLVDRNAISMRLVAIAAMVVLLLAPESLLSASFQMSFAAVVALVAVYEAMAPRFSRWRGSGGWTTKVAIFVAATLLTTVVANAATAPFALYHFNRLALYGLAANMVAVPLTAVWIMPWAVVAFLLMPLGLDGLALTPMGWGIDLLLKVAAFIASLPGAVTMVPPFPVLGLAAVAVGGLWLCLWRGRLRLAGFALIAAGIAGAALARAPDILVDSDGRLFAVNFGGGRVALSPGAGQRFDREMWLRHLGAADALAWPDDGGTAGLPFACDGAGCVARLRGRTVSFVLDPAAAVEDCGRVDEVVLLARMPRFMCRGSAVAGSTFGFWRDGAHAIFLHRRGPPTVETVRESRGERPWSRLSPKKRQYLRIRPTRRP